MAPSSGEEKPLHPYLQKAAIPLVCVLIAALAYPSQILLAKLEPGPLSTKETIWLNLMSLTIWVSYYRAVTTDPGRLPERIKKEGTRDYERERNGQSNWCKKCDAIKPPRAHHCKICRRCIPKMDHHCPWTSTCTSHTTLPPFLRFLFYATTSLALLLSHLLKRVSHIWSTRNSPSYLGPSKPLLGWLLYVTFITTMLVSLLFVLFATSLRALALNETSIEQREMERHEVLLNRARHNGGYVYGPGGVRISIQRQEFPYDIGIWKNIVQGMGTANLIRWFLPWEGGADNERGWEWETNGFEDEGTHWPPPDPEKVPRTEETWRGGMEIGGGETMLDGSREAFRQRQEADLRRRRGGDGGRKQHGWLELEDSGSDHGEDGYSEDYDYENAPGMGSGWWTGEKHPGSGELGDLGVDESTEYAKDDDDDDIPLAELRRRLLEKEKLAGG